MTQPPDRARLSIVGYFALFCLVMFGMYSPLLAQEQDPYTVDPASRLKASLPVAYGLILTGTYPFVGGTTSDFYDYESQFFFSIQAYYDTWQLGYSHKPYGNTFSLTFRSVGRDPFVGWYIEYGSQTVRQQLVLDSIEYLFSRTLYGIGSRYTNGYGKETKFQFSSGLSGGIASVDDVDERLDVYLSCDLGVGARIPIGISGLSLGVYGMATLYPSSHNISAESALDYELGGYASFGLNFSGN